MRGKVEGGGERWRERALEDEAMYLKRGGGTQGPGGWKHLLHRGAAGQSGGGESIPVRRGGEGKESDQEGGQHDYLQCLDVQSGVNSCLPVMQWIWRLEGA